MSPRRVLTGAPAVSEELFAPVGNDVELCYQTFGDPEGEPLLLVMGLGGPMNWWDTELCLLLAAEGFFVVRYDNRDTGRSSRIRARVTRGQLVRAFSGRRTKAPYSMGGMIVQTIAVEHPGRVRSLTSIMSTTGRRTVGWQDPRIIPALLAPRKPGRESYVQTSVAFWGVIGSPAWPAPPERLAERAGETFDRGYSASGMMRQMMAILKQEDRTHRLRSLRVPALVIHGTADKMVHLSGGRSTAAAIHGSELVTVDGMGHDLPPELFATFVEAIARTADRA